MLALPAFSSYQVLFYNWLNNILTEHVHVSEETHWNHTNSSTGQVNLWPKLQKILKTCDFCFLVWSCLVIWLLSEAKSLVGN